MMETTKTSHAAIKVNITQRGLEAWVRIVPPIPVRPDEIRRALASEGVVEGIDDVALANLAEFPQPEPVLVAKGQAAKPGDPARIEFYFSTEARGLRPQLDDEGRADLRELGPIENVVEGQVLARKIPPTPGEPGLTVTGQPIAPTPGKDMRIVVGKNVILSPDNLEAIAQVTGIPSVQRKRTGDKIEITPVFQVQDVDFSVGNINFQGSVIIRGNVLPGFTVKASESIEVTGGVESATLEAGEIVRVGRGIRNNSNISAREIFAKFVDSNSTLTARQHIFISGDAVQCNLSAGRRIEVKDSIIGGVTKAGESIIAGTIGSVHEVKTFLQIVEEHAENLVETLQNQITELERDVLEITNLIQMVMANPAQQQGPFSLQKLTPQKVTKTIQLAQLKSELKELLENPEPEIKPKITAKGEIYSGALLRFGPKMFKVTDKLYGKSFTLVDGEIHH